MFEEKLLTDHLLVLGTALGAKNTVGKHSSHIALPHAAYL